jgi:hypothetical protein
MKIVVEGISTKSLFNLDFLCQISPKYIKWFFFWVERCRWVSALCDVFFVLRILYTIQGNVIVLRQIVIIKHVTVV